MCPSSQQTLGLKVKPRQPQHSSLDPQHHLSAPLSLSVSRERVRHQSAVPVLPATAPANILRAHHAAGCKTQDETALINFLSLFREENISDLNSS